MGICIAQKIDGPGDDLFSGLSTFDDQADAVHFKGKHHQLGPRSKKG